MKKTGRKKQSKKVTLATYKQLQKEVKNVLTSRNLSALPTYATSQAKQFDINDEIARRENIKNNDLEQDIKLKKIALRNLFTFLGIETVFVFAFALMQATTLWGFHLEEWSFKLLITATLAQIVIMLQVAVKYLFRDKKQG